MSGQGELWNKEGMLGERKIKIIPPREGICLWGNEKQPAESNHQGRQWANRKTRGTQETHTWHGKLMHSHAHEASLLKQQPQQTIRTLEPLQNEINLICHHYNRYQKWEAAPAGNAIWTQADSFTYAWRGALGGFPSGTEKMKSSCKHKHQGQYCMPTSAFYKEDRKTKFVVLLLALHKHQGGFKGVCNV